jgi:hypothetical protein
MRLDPETSARLIRSPAASGQDQLVTMLALAVLVPICLWVFRDARRRYPGPGMPLLWAALVFLALIVFLPLYLFLRPPKRDA